MGSDQDGQTLSSIQLTFIPSGGASFGNGSPNSTILEDINTESAEGGIQLWASADAVFDPASDTFIPINFLNCPRI